MNEQIVELATQVGDKVSHVVSAGATQITESALFHNLMASVSSNIGQDILNFLSKSQG